MSDDFARTTAERHPHDPHLLGPVTKGSGPLGFWRRSCSCGWNLASVDRDHVMREALRHRRWVAIARKATR